MTKTQLRESSKTSQQADDLKVINLSDEQLAKINEQTIAPFGREEVFAFSILLIDDAPTRNGTLYPESFQRTILSKEARKGSWVGLTLLMGENEDHETKASNQVARIYDARLVKTPRGNVGTIGEAYIPINKSTKGFIDSIRAGIHREVSIGVAVEEPTCSICSHDIRSCDHEPTAYYGEEQCIIVMNGDAEAQEVSFVAVPGSYNAEVLSSTSGYVPLKEAFGKTTIQKERNNMTKKKTVSKEALLAQDIAAYGRMIEAKLAQASKEVDDNEEEVNDDEDLNGVDNNDDGSDKHEYPDDAYGSDNGLDDDEDDDEDDYEDPAKHIDFDDDAFDEADDDDEEVEDEDKLKTTEALKSTFKTMKRMEKRMRVLESQAKAGRFYHKQVLNETVRLGVLSKTIPVQSKETFRKTFERMSLSELLEFQKGYKVEVERMYPSTGKSLSMAEKVANNKENAKMTESMSMGISDIINEFTR